MRLANSSARANQTECSPRPCLLFRGRHEERHWNDLCESISSAIYQQYHAINPEDLMATAEIEALQTNPHTFPSFYLAVPGATWSSAVRCTFPSSKTLQGDGDFKGRLPFYGTDHSGGPASQPYPVRGTRITSHRITLPPGGPDKNFLSLRSAACLAGFFSPRHPSPACPPSSRTHCICTSPLSCRCRMHRQVQLKLLNP